MTLHLFKEIIFFLWAKGRNSELRIIKKETLSLNSKNILEYH